MKNKMEVICLIDDDDIYQFTATRSIQATGLVEKIMVFSDGEEALVHLKGNESTPEEIPDIIFLDINMPVMDGWQFLEEFVKIKPRMPKQITIYMVSSSVDERDLSAAKNIEEISDYIVKPITKQMFSELIDKLGR